MNDRLNIQDLIDLLAEKHGMDKKDADGFVKEFFLLIEQALESDRYVKIKGLGTFKLIDVDSRESVNVNTGERFQIQGHTKVSFTPDPVLRDVINKPFAHFETVVLNENTVLEDTPMEESEDESEDAGEVADIVTNGVPVVEESAEKETVEVEPTEIIAAEIATEVKTTEIKTTEIKATEVMTMEVVAMEQSSPKEEKATGPESDVEIASSISKPLVASVASEPSVTPEPWEEVVNVSDDVAEAPIAPVALEPEYKRTAEEIIAAELEKSNAKFRTILPEQQMPSLTEQELPQSSVHSKEQVGKSPVLYLVAIIILVLLLCSSALLFVYYPDLFAPTDKKELTQLPATQSAVQQEILLDTVAAKDAVVAKDTIAEVVPGQKEEIKPIPVVPVKKVPEPVKSEAKTTAKSAIPTKSDSVNYKIAGTKTTYTIKEGETLTRVSMRFYGTKDLWPYIVQHNRDIIKNPDNVPYGTTLKIPELVKR